MPTAPCDEVIHPASDVRQPVATCLLFFTHSESTHTLPFPGFSYFCPVVIVESCVVRRSEGSRRLFCGHPLRNEVSCSDVFTLHNSPPACLFFCHTGYNLAVPHPSLLHCIFPRLGLKASEAIGRQPNSHCITAKMADPAPENEKKYDQSADGDAARSPSESDVEQDTSGINEKALLRKLDYKLLPAVSVLYLLSFLDRSNGECFFYQVTKWDIH